MIRLCGATIILFYLSNTDDKFIPEFRSDDHNERQRMFGFILFYSDFFDDKDKLFNMHHEISCKVNSKLR